MDPFWFGRRQVQMRCAVISESFRANVMRHSLGEGQDF